MLYSTLRFLLAASLLNLLTAGPGWAELTASAPISKSLEFVENKGQWDARAQYMAELPAGRLFLEKTGFTYTFADPKALRTHKEHSSPGGGPVADKLRAHAYRVTFEGGRSAVTLTPNEPTTGFRNYFLGNDSKQWAAGVRGFRQVSYANVYAKIGARLYENEGGNLEYDFTVAPGGKPATIRLRYTGAERLTLEGGHLLIQTSVGTITEQAPRAWQELNGRRVPVECAFVLHENVVSFRLGAYNSKQPLLIDPTVVFSSFTGSGADNWGYTATYDAQGNMYSGGIVFGLGYPASVGAFNQSFSGGVDVGIIKYNTTVRGSAARLYATYLGGNLVDTPHSLVVNSQNELVILGSTGSNNFPVPRTSFDNSFNGGPSIDPLDTSLPSMEYSNGVDLFVAKLNGTGSALLASTYLGGNGTDGVIPPLAGGLVQNYGDSFRGDVITDTDGNIYIASTTTSTNFPARNGFRNSPHGGDSDAVVVKFSTDLRTLVWSSYLGGTGADAAYSIQLDNDRNVYVSGGTSSANLPGTSGRYQPQARGEIDGFAARINNEGTAVTHATYLGTEAMDQAYFLQLDAAANVYVLGLTRGAFPRTAGLYGVANGRQFIQKFDNTLTTSLYSTAFGAGRTAPDLSLTAFLVDDCERIYVSGWGGLRGSGDTRDLPTTPNAIQPTTDGADFYLVQFKPGVTAIEYATFFGGVGGNGEHVDGGTSRFDKRGAIYQAVCGGCGGSSQFPVPPGANFYSPTNNSRNCNNAAFKIDFAAGVVNLGPNRRVCYNAGPQPLTASPGGGVWSGPGITAVPGGGYQFTPSPALVGNNTLTYTVTTTGICQATEQLRMTVIPEVAIAFAPLPAVCSNTATVPLTATPAGGTFSGPGVSGRTFDVRIAGVGTHTISYTLADSLGCNSTSQTIVVDASPTVTVSPDTIMCSDQARGFRTVRAFPAGGVWSGTGVTADGFFTPPTDNSQGGVYTLTYTVTAGACKIIGTRKVTVTPLSSTNVSLNIPQCQAAPEYAGVAPFTMRFNPILAGGSFIWDFGDGTTSNEETPTHVYEREGEYPVQLTARYAGCTVVTQFAAVKVGGVRVPNIFTPNNDNLNETFAPRLGCLPAHLTVFNRWGNKVYEAAEYHNDWRGDALPEGIYYYLLRDTVGKSTKGWVEIKR